MDPNYKINNLCLRYAVPFRLGINYDEAVDRISKEKTWIPFTGDIEISESDLYEYIREEMWKPAGDDPESKEDAKRIGSEWIYSGNVRSVPKENGSSGEENFGAVRRKMEAATIRKFSYFPDQLKTPGCMDLEINYAGIRLYKNGHGLFWFEISVANKGKKKDEKTVFHDAQELVQFQYRVRELNRNNHCYLWEKCVNIRDASQGEEEIIPHMDLGIVYQRTELSENRIKTDYLAPFLLGYWIQEQLAFLGTGYRFFAERKPVYSSLYKQYCNIAKKTAVLNGEAEDSEAEPRILGHGEYTVKDFGNAPDKLILFSYCGFMGAEEEAEPSPEEWKQRQKLTYWLANGYKDSYHLSEEVGGNMMRPFNEVLWFATLEGVVYTSWAEKDNMEFYANGLIPKFRSDYFRLFLKVLYQSYSLLLYAERIQREVPAAPIDREHKWPEEEVQKVEKLYGEISLFQAKSMATTVSHIHHQSEFYIYLKKRFHIHDDVKSVSAGLDAVNALLHEIHRMDEEKQRDKENERIAREQEVRAKEWIEEQKRKDEEQREWRRAEEREQASDNRIQKILTIFAVLGIGSAFVDWYQFVWDVADGERWSGAGLGRFIAEMVILVIVLGISIYAGIQLWMAHKEMKASSEEGKALDNASGTKKREKGE